MTPGLTEILIVVLIVVLLFGAKRIPGLARGIGKSVTSFKAGIREKPEDEEVDQESDTGKKTS
jgi:sec-independent protein translocase protein TatA